MEINCLNFNCLDSTSTWSKANYKNFDPKKLTLVSADQQTAGHGRYKRSWISPPGQNIYATYTFFIEKSRQDIANVTQVTALAAVKTLEELGFESLLKWPNDLLINRKKVGGILCEMDSHETYSVIMIGMGININMPLEILQQINQPATSLMVESNRMFQVPQVLQKLTHYLNRDLTLFLHEGFHPFLSDYRKHLLHKKGDPLLLNEQKGFFQAIDNQGALVMLLQDGSEQKFFAGEIIG